MSRRMPMRAARNRSSARPAVEPLEPRQLAASGIFIENFSADQDLATPGFDSAQDGFRFDHQFQGGGGSITSSTPDRVAPDATFSPPHHLFLVGTDVITFPDLAADENIVLAKVNYVGNVSVTFIGTGGQVRTFHPAADYFTVHAVSVGSAEPADNGQPLGPITQIWLTGLESSFDDLTVLVLPTSSDRPPLARDDGFTIDPADGGAALDVLTNDSDADADPLQVRSAGPAAHGTVENRGSDVVYTPAPGFVGVDSFAYTVDDGRGGSATATVAVTVDHRPVAIPDDYPLPHGATGPVVVAAANGVLADDHDPDGDPLTLAVVDGPQHGSVVLHADGSFTYTPAGARVLSDSFVYRLSDGHLGDDTTVTLTVANTPPTAGDVTYHQPHGRADLLGGFGASTRDADGDPLTFTVVSPPRFGTVTVTGAGFRYVPDAGAVNGDDTFTYRASDGVAFSNLATVSIRVPNEPPVAVDSSVEIPIDQAIVAGSVLATADAAGRPLVHASDPDGDRLIATLVREPTHGQVTLQPDGSFTYTLPHNGLTGELFGSDTFAYTVTDGYSQSNVATVRILQSLGRGIARSDVYTFAHSEGIHHPDEDIDQDLGLFYVARSGVVMNDSFSTGVGAARFVSAVEDTTADAWNTIFNGGYAISFSQDVHASPYSPFLEQDGRFYFHGYGTPSGELPRFRYQFLYPPPGLPANPTLSELARSNEAVVLIQFVDTPQADSDGVDDRVEAAAPHSGDGNADGLPDALQSDVASLPAATTGQYVSLVAAGRAILFGVAARTDLPSPPASLSFPLGFFGFQVAGLVPGEATTVTLQLPPGVAPAAYYKYGPTPGNRSPHWYNFTFDGTTGAEFQPGRIILHLVDGARGDDDLEPNGIIVDPGGPAVDAGARYVAGLYRTVLHRPPDPAGAAAWLVRLAAGSSRAQVADGFWTSAEHRGLQVDALYDRLLHRRPDPAGRAFWIDQLFRGRLDESALAQRFLLSPEYRAAHPDPTAYVRALYTDLLALPLFALPRPGFPDTARIPPQELSQRGPISEGLARRIASDVLSSPAARLALVDRLYQDLLGRPADPTGRAVWLKALGHGRTPRQIAEALLSSGEFLAAAGR